MRPPRRGSPPRATPQLSDAQRPPQLDTGIVRRSLRLALALVSAAIVLWSFQRVLGRALGSDAAGDEQAVELVVMHWSGDAGQREDEIVDGVLSRFEASNPGIRVRRINPGDAASFYTKLQTMLAAGTPPDVFYVGSERVPAFASMGLLEPLEPFIEADAARPEAPDPIDLDAFYPATVGAYRYDDGAMGRGPLYGVPKDFTTIGFYYNRDLLRRAGLEDPRDDWTWDDFARAARSVGALEGCTGAEFVTWPPMVRAYLGTYGADVVGEDFERLTLRDPATWSALDQLRSWRHDEPDTLTSGKSKIAEGSTVFLTGRVGFAGPFGRWVVPSYRDIPPSGAERGFDWDFAPLPRGTESSNVVLSVAWAMSSQTEYPEQAWRLIKALTSPTTQDGLSRLGLAIPTLRAVAESDAFTDPTLAPGNDAAYLRAADVAGVTAWPEDPRFEILFRTRLDEALKTGTATLEEAVEGFEREWALVSSSPLARGDFEPLDWAAIERWSLRAALALALILGWHLLRAPGGRFARAQERTGLALVAPWLAGFAAFMAIPIAVSLILSFSRWNGQSTLESARWVGLANYAQILGHDDRFLTSLRVTLYYVLLAVPLGQAFALAAALLMNLRLPGIGFFRAAWYLPSVLAGVGISVLWRWVFDGDAGLLNALLTPLLEPFGLSPPEWFGADAAAFGPPAFALQSLWMVGGAMMIYLAGLKGIPEELYEAASIDGAGSARRLVTVTLPMLSPVIFFNGIMGIIASFQVFTQAFVMTGGEPGDLTRFYVLYVYNQAFEYYEMGYASALAWMLLITVLALTALTMWGSKRFVHYEGLAG
jgi:multiple sugar transport system permease protein